MLAPTHISCRSCPCPESKFRLLYVGCDFESLVALRNVLRKPQFQLIACSDRGSAVLFLKSQIPYHLLLIDLEWRGREGLKLARLAHSLRHRKQMATVIVAATKLTRHMGALAREAGADECVMKTQDMAGVTEAITRLLLIEGRESKPTD